MRILVTLCCALAISCGGESEENNPPPVDTAPPVDAPKIEVAKNIGSPCTPNQAMPQGDCPSGFLCIPFQTGNSVCTKPCSQGAGDTCNQGYMGPGFAACVFGVQQPEGDPLYLCGVVCDDETPNNQICPATVCDGTCPGTLQCNQPLMDAMMNVVAKACL